MTQWYGPQGDYSHVNGQGGEWTPDGQGGYYWRPYAGSSADPNKTIWYGPNANYPGANPTAPTTPTTPTGPPSYDPPTGGPTYTPGIAFGAGTIPGQGENYQRQWFDVGPSGSTEGLNQTYYDDPSNWNYAWDKVLNQFGGTVGGDFYKFLQGFSNTARGDFQNTVPYDPTLHVANFLDQYAPQIAGVYKLMPSTQTHGGTGGIAGRSTY